MNFAWLVSPLGVLSLIAVTWLLGLWWWAARRRSRSVGVFCKIGLTLALLGGETELAHQLGGLLQAGGVVENAPAALALVTSLVVAGLLLSLFWTPQIARLLLSPLTHLLDGGQEPPVRQPAYSAAIFQRQHQRPREAILRIREQLAEFPNDYKGILLLAHIQAEDLEDLPAAESTVRRFCQAPGVPEAQALAALTQLADWHLNRTAEVDAGLAVMVELMTRFPHAEISRRITQRLGRSTDWFTASGIPSEAGSGSEQKSAGSRKGHRAG